MQIKVRHILSNKLYPILKTMKILPKTKLYIFALAPTGEGISGSDRIFIELAREWSKFIPVTIYTTQEGIDMMKHKKLTGKKLKIEKVEKRKLPDSFLLKYIYKIFLGIKLGFSLPITNNQSPITFLYSSSDFWMDVFPAVLLKLRFNKIKWISTWYQTAPNPLVGYKEGEREESYNLSALFYWLSQLVSRPLIKRYANKVIVNNEDEKKQFPGMNREGKVIILIGAVRLDEIKKYQSQITLRLRSGEGNHKSPIFDAVFQGRFHPQKGVVELIDIWKKVVEKLPDAKLAMIGDGPLMGNVKAQISKLKLEKNIKLFGYVFDGHKKYSIFAKSKIVVHPAFYDSGGMASAEAMAFGLPVIGFDLKSYESYYPKGMEKVEIGNLDKFAKKIIYLIKIQLKRKKLGREARELVQGQLSWEKRASEV